MCKFPESKSQKSPLELWKKKKISKVAPPTLEIQVFFPFPIYISKIADPVMSIVCEDGEMRHDLLDDGFDGGLRRG